MKKDTAELPPDVRAQMEGLESLPDDLIDTTDAPEILDWSDARRGVFYRPQGDPTEPRGVVDSERSACRLPRSSDATGGPA